MLETENRMLHNALRDAGIELVPQISKMGLLRTKVLELGVQHGLGNVRIKRGVIEIRHQGEWQLAEDIG
jgi:hypothetical protein